ncbi:hypothetical protein HPB50_027075 [Hyalomma asiaticum]|uniref:Uncharacterized protein n=1 Tax=Hyalomma asiaticum TaxID=266040 RepID=A0ACB7TRZ7_HYAAI|nr:hypothetical protein HPB50_027075 [Hyalomma asiaticum]
MTELRRTQPSASDCTSGRLQVRTARSEGDVCSSVEVSCRRRHHCADFEEFGRHRKNGTRSAQRPASERVKVLGYLVGENSSPRRDLELTIVSLDTCETRLRRGLQAKEPEVQPATSVAAHERQAIRVEPKEGSEVEECCGVNSELRKGREDEGGSDVSELDQVESGSDDLDEQFSAAVGAAGDPAHGRSVGEGPFSRSVKAIGGGPSRERDGDERLVTVFSRAHVPTPEKEPADERGSFAAVWTKETFGRWIFGIKVRLKTDHYPLTFLARSAPLSASPTC